MSVIEQPTVPTVHTVTFDLYRDIHKGIRGQLFGVTGTAGNVDPADRAARVALATRVAALSDLLESHAHHEDASVQPAIERYLPDVADIVTHDHASFERRLEIMNEIAAVAVDATGGEQRVRVHQLYMEMAAFTSSYLAHQDLEERVIMPRLEAAIGVDAVLDINRAIVASIPPDQMASSLVVMLPAMNVDDRAELLGGIQHGAPTEVFAGVWGLTGSVLTATDYTAVGERLGLE